MEITQEVTATTVRAVATAFEKKEGRKLRVLHIGNIANNAYLNAKLLREAGMEADVLCHCYFHIMGTPEWEEAELSAETTRLLDGNYPDWSSISLGGYQRPRWFVSGSLLVCANYLRAKNAKSMWTPFWWALLSVENRTSRTGSLGHRFLSFSLAIASLWLRFRSYAPFFAAMSKAEAREYVANRIRRALTRAPSATVPFWAKPIAAVLVKTAKILSARIPQPNFSELQRLLEKHFPARTDRLEVADYKEYASELGDMHRIFSHYDLVHCYATCGIYPLLLGHRPYVAYEHGTIRGIPYERTGTGRLTALSFAEADSVFLTNTDSPKSLRRLRPSPSQHFVPGLHGFDERGLRRRLEKGLANPNRVARFGVPKITPLFFCPSRHDWAVKGNDTVLRAAGQLRAEGQSFVLVLVRWGGELARSEQLISELGLTENIRWIEPLGKPELLAAYYDADAILDQFVCGAFGAVTIEALAVGRAPLITRLNAEELTAFFGETIPLFNAADADEVAAALRTILQNPKESEKRVAACDLWMATHHSHQRLLDVLGTCYGAALGLSAAGESVPSRSVSSPSAPLAGPLTFVKEV